MRKQFKPESSIYSLIAENIYSARTAQRLTQKEFGDRYGKCQSSVAGWEASRREISGALYLQILNDYHAWSKARWAARP